MSWFSRRKKSTPFDKNFLRELKEMEIRVTSSFKPEKKPKKGNFTKNQDGEYMTCILCGANANKAGFFCDEHDDGSYQKPSDRKKK